MNCSVHHTPWPCPCGHSPALGAQEAESGLKTLPEATVATGDPSIGVKAGALH